MSNQKFFIRSAAIGLLEELYLKSNSSLNATINTYDIKDDNIDENIIQKASQYLIDKHLVESRETATREWTAKITHQGIDWIEDWYNINPGKYY